jgi:hypothetical protein
MVRWEWMGGYNTTSLNIITEGLIDGLKEDDACRHTYMYKKGGRLSTTPSNE